MFMMQISSQFTYIVLLASTGLLIWSLRNKGAGSFLGKIVGSAVLILSVLSILCTGYYSVKHWKHGGFERHMGMGMGMHMGMNKDMMENMMGNMGKMMGKMGETGPQKEEDHASHQPN